MLGDQRSLNKTGSCRATHSLAANPGEDATWAQTSDLRRIGVYNSASIDSARICRRGMGLEAAAADILTKSQELAPGAGSQTSNVTSDPTRIDDRLACSLTFGAFSLCLRRVIVKYQNYLRTIVPITKH
jgi:hypothetical protein